MATWSLAPQKLRADDRPAHLALSPTAVKIGKPHSHWGRASLAMFWASPSHNQLRNQLCIGNEGVNLHKKDGAVRKGLHLLCPAGTTPKGSRSNGIYSDCLLQYLCAPPQNNRRGTSEMSAATKPDTHMLRQGDGVNTSARRFRSSWPLGRDCGDTRGAPASKSRQSWMPAPQGTESKEDMTWLNTQTCPWHTPMHPG